MPELLIDFEKISGKIKPMHAVNNGPLKKKNDQTRDNFDTYKAAEIPFARNHDASFFAGYGGAHSVDITAVFPDFDADPYDPASYDFVLTDEYIENTAAAGTETFYRLGQKIEHEIKKYGTIPPKDFKKWAVICEHMIRHFNEGWADGHYFGIHYFEIWNEPDLNDGVNPDGTPNKRTWGGTMEQFFDLYEIAAKHLKSCFPDLKIGGPALAGDIQWAEAFLKMMRDRNVPTDFFSWHIYACNPMDIVSLSRKIRGLMEKYGFGKIESILNEWNYVRGWSDEFVYSIKQIIGIKGAVFNADVMCRLQHENVDMLMYYDARPSCFNGLWDFYTMKPFKGYYPFLMFSRLYKLGYQLCSPSDINGVSVTAATDRSGNGGIMLAYYTDDDSVTAEKTLDIHLTGIVPRELTISLLDVTHDCEPLPLPAGSTFTITMKPKSVIYISVKS